MTFNNLSSNKLKYGIGSLFVILFAFAGVKLLNNSHASQTVYSGKLLGIGASIEDPAPDNGTTNHMNVLNQLGVNSERGEIDFKGSSFDNPNYQGTTAQWINTLTSGHTVPLPLFNQYIEMSSLNISAFSSAVASWCQQYCSGGTFYNNNSSANAAYAPQALEILNEPYGDWWGYPVTTADMQAYANLLTQVRKDLDSANLNNISILAAANDNWGGTKNWDTQLVADGGFAEAQGITVHPYGPVNTTCTPSTSTTNCVVTSGSSNTSGTSTSGWGLVYYVHQFLINNGLSSQANNMYATEVGYCNTTTPDPCSGGNFQETVKDQNISAIINQLGAVSWLKGLWYFNLQPYQDCLQRDQQGQCTNLVYNTYGLYTPPNPNRVQTPAWTTFQGAATTVKSQYSSEFSLSTSNTTPPTVNITSPSNNASVSGTIQISSNATDKVGVASVQFTVDGKSIGSVTSAPYSINWDTNSVSNGSHTIAAIAKNTAGNTATSTVTVNVNNKTVSVGYHIVGNRIYDSSNNVFEPHGVDVPTFIWSCGGIKSYNADTGSSTFNTADFQTMKSKWGTNTIRLSVSQDLWLPGAQQGSSYGCSSTTYQQNIKNVVQAARSAGIVVLLDLHWSDQGNLSNPSNQQCMPDVNSETFWKSAASSFMNDSGVWFEIYNEPHPNNWSIWLNGGSVCGFTSVGMQQLVDTVRATGASNIIMAGGDGYAAHLDGVPLLSGTNIGYVIHPYANPTNPSGYSTSDWNNRFGNLSATQAVIATEFGDPQTTGSSACSATASAPYTSAILSYFKQHSIGYTAWAYYDDYSKLNTSPGPCHFPVLLNPDGTCYANDGSCLIQTDLQSYTSTGSGGVGGGTGGGGTPSYVQGFNFNASTKTLSWTAYPGAATYTIAEVHNPTTTRNTNYSWPHVAATSCVPGGSCNVPAPAPGETLHFGIIPLDSNGNAMAGTGSCAPSVCWAPEINVTWPKPTNTDTQAPTKPTNLLASSGSPYQINLTWTASKDNIGVAGYRIYRSKSGSLPVSVGTSTATSYGDTGLSPNTLYAYYVVAYDAANNKSSPSSNASTKTQASSTKTVTVEGVVSSSKSGLPIVDAFVKTGNYATPNGPVSAYTNRLGQYSLGGITPPTWQHYYFYSASGYKTVTIHTILSAGINTQNVKLTP